MADHGGFVGLDYMKQAQKKSMDRDIIYSIFSSNLLIHWPNNEPPSFDGSLKSSVNLFRIIISYLSNNTKYLSHLQEDISYIPIDTDAPNGIYEYIDNNGKIIFNKYFEN